MKDFIHIGSAPPEEGCAQVGRPDYWERARCECREYISLLRRALGPEPEGARLAVKSNEHDFGTYLSVVCHFEEQWPVSVEYALRCESEGPATWDDEARRELSERGW